MANTQTQNPDVSPSGTVPGTPLIGVAALEKAIEVMRAGYPVGSNKAMDRRIAGMEEDLSTLYVQEERLAVTLAAHKEITESLKGQRHTSLVVTLSWDNTGMLTVDAGPSPKAAKSQVGAIGIGS